jgi:hypothetical protein
MGLRLWRGRRSCDGLGRFGWDGCGEWDADVGMGEVLGRGWLQMVVMKNAVDNLQMSRREERNLKKGRPARDFI